MPPTPKQQPKQKPAEISERITVDLNLAMQANGGRFVNLKDSNDLKGALDLLADIHSDIFTKMRSRLMSDRVPRLERLRAEREIKDTLYRGIRQTGSYVMQIADFFIVGNKNSGWRTEVLHTLNADNLILAFDARLEFDKENSRELRPNTVSNIEREFRNANVNLLNENDKFELSKAAYLQRPTPELLDGMRKIMDGMELPQLQNDCEYKIRMLKLYEYQGDKDAIERALSATLELYRNVLAIRGSISLPSTDLQIANTAEVLEEEKIRDQLLELIKFQDMLVALTEGYGNDYFDSSKIEDKAEIDRRARRIHDFDFVAKFEEIGDLMARAYRSIRSNPKFKDYAYTPETPITFGVDGTKIYGMTFNDFQDGEEAEDGEFIYKFDNDSLARVTIEMIKRNVIGIYVARKNLYRIGTYVERLYSRGDKLDTTQMAWLRAEYNPAELQCIQLLHSLNSLLLGDGEKVGLRETLKRSGLYRLARDSRRIRRAAAKDNLLQAGLKAANTSSNPLVNALADSSNN